METGRRLPWDWHTGTIPDNADIDEAAYVETSYSFLMYRSEVSVGFRLCRGASIYKSTMLDVGPHGRVGVGEYALIHGARIICDAEVDIGAYALISWNVVVLDTYRVPLDREARRYELTSLAGRPVRRLASAAPARRVQIGRNVWIGFEACVLPGVTIGNGAVVGARSVVSEDVPAYAVVAGNPARIIRRLNPPTEDTHEI